MWTVQFWKETFERAVKSAAQAPLTVWMVGDVALDAFKMDYQLALGVALGGALVSVLTSLASITVSAGESGSPSLVYLK